MTLQKVRNSPLDNQAAEKHAADWRNKTRDGGGSCETLTVLCSHLRVVEFYQFSILQPEFPADMQSGTTHRVIGTLSYYV